MIRERGQSTAIRLRLVNLVGMSGIAPEEDELFLLQVGTNLHRRVDSTEDPRLTPAAVASPGGQVELEDRLGAAIVDDGEDASFRSATLGLAGGANA